MIHSGKSFFSTNYLNIYLNIASGLRMPNLSQIFPRPYVKKFLNMFSFFSDICLALDLVTITIPLFSSTVPIEERCMGTFIAITATQSLLKSLHFTVYGQEIQTFMDNWEKSHQGGPFKEEEERLGAAERRFVKIASVSFISFMVIPPFACCLMPYFPFIQEMHGGRFLPVPSYFPFETLTSPVYELIILFQTVTAVIGVSKSVAFDLFFFTLASLEVTQLKYLHLRMENIFHTSKEIQKCDREFKLVEKNVLSGILMNDRLQSDRPNIFVEEEEGFQSKQQPKEANQLASESDHSTNNLGCEEKTDMHLTNWACEAEETLMQDFKLWVIHHQETISLVNKLQAVYSPILLIQLITTILILCFSAFVAKEVTTLDALQKQSTAMNVLCHMALMFLWCNYGDRVAEESALLSVAGLANGWENCRDKPVVSSLKIIAHRTQIPLQLSAMGVFKLGAETFLEVTRLAISYLLVLIDLKD